ncbi:MAG: SDR family oxidoreductase [Planctomycetota bacterium]
MLDPAQPDAARKGGSRPLRVFLTGATGYIGGRLAPRLLDAGHSVRCLVREPRKLAMRHWFDHPRVEIVQGDVLDAEALAGRMAGCDVGYYLIHSMEASGGEFADRDRSLASSFAEAAARAGLSRVIYLGGLGEMGPDLSEHLRSRREVEQILEAGTVPVTAFRAAMIMGSGSASFEILRYLVERLPVMVTPKWVETKSQPVGIADILHWMVRCLHEPGTIGQTLELGGADVLTYRQLMQEMADALGLGRRIMLTVPVLTPKLSSLWIGLVTPVSDRIARPLAEGLKNPVVVGEHDVQRLMPHEPMTARQAIDRAVERTTNAIIETRWSAAGAIPGDPDWAGGRVFTDSRNITIRAEPDAVFAAVCRVGGGHGWYAADILWRIRGWMDQAMGGPGLRRGRRHPDEVEFGEALDFWRVIGINRPTHLHLLAEMKLPGQAALEFDITPAEEPGVCTLAMTARFRPKGLLGLAYWYSVLPLHNIVFNGMLRGMRSAAESDAPPAAGQHA